MSSRDAALSRSAERAEQQRRYADPGGRPGPLVGAVLSSAVGAALLGPAPVVGVALCLVAVALSAVVLEDQRRARRPAPVVPRGFDVAFRRPATATLAVPAVDLALVPAPPAPADLVVEQAPPAPSGPRLRGRTIIWHLPPGQVRRRARTRADLRPVVVAGRHHR